MPDECDTRRPHVTSSHDNVKFGYKGLNIYKMLALHIARDDTDGNFEGELGNTRLGFHLGRKPDFWDTAVPCGSEYNHNEEKLNPNESRLYPLTSYRTLVPPLSRQSIRAITRNPY